MPAVALIGPVTSAELLHWDYALSHWAPDKIYLVGPWPLNDTKSKVFKDAVEIASLSEVDPSYRLVLMSPANAQHFPGDTSIIKYDHPENACYIFGSNHRHIKEEDLAGRSPDDSVFIPTDTRDEMHSYVACALTLYDRKYRRG